MAGLRLVGPVGLDDGTTPPIDDGTSARTAMAAPGTVGAVPSSAGVAATASASDPDIEALNLSPTARRAAYALKKAHPTVTFTSGRRNKEDQARAMASNVVHSRTWIQDTYLSSTVSTACQKWVDTHKDAKTQDDIAAGLLSVLNDAKDEDLAKLSKHLSGDAFDVQPVETNADAIKKTIRGLDGLDKFLEKEGGLVRWHAQF